MSQRIFKEKKVVTELPRPFNLNELSLVYIKFFLDHATPDIFIFWVATKIGIIKVLTFLSCILINESSVLSLVFLTPQ